MCLIAPPTPAKTIASSVLASGHSVQSFICAVHPWQEQSSGVRAFAPLSATALIQTAHRNPARTSVVTLASGSAGLVVGEKLIHQCLGRRLAPGKTTSEEYQNLTYISQHFAPRAMLSFIAEKLGVAGGHERRVIRGNASKPESKLRIWSIPFCSMTDRCTASRADSCRYPRTICFACCTTVSSTAST